MCWLLFGISSLTEFEPFLSVVLLWYCNWSQDTPYQHYLRLSLHDLIGARVWPSIVSPCLTKTLSCAGLRSLFVQWLIRNVYVHVFS